MRAASARDGLVDNRGVDTRGVDNRGEDNRGVDTRERGHPRWSAQDVYVLLHNQANQTPPLTD